MASPEQLGLNISLREEARFVHFIADNDDNRAVVAAFEARLVRAGASDFEPLLVWGRSGVGITYLMQAYCQEASDQGLQVQYLPLKELLSFPATMVCEGLEAVDAVCIDDLHAIAGNAEWEEGLFHLFNRLRNTGAHVLASAQASPRELMLKLPDLKSRMLSGLVYQVHALSDEGLKHALIHHAQTRGLELEEDVANYVLARAPRDPQQLFPLLETLDQRSLSEQRRLTIPFVKEVMSAEFAE